MLYEVVLIKMIKLLVGNPMSATFIFKHELKEETINLVLEKFPEFNNLYPNLVE